MRTKNNNDFSSIKHGACVGILGGSFDPPHLSHELLALSFLALENIDELWVIPCANHAFKHDLTSFHHRMAMCQIAFGRINNVRVLDIENTLAAPNYTIETINFILQKRPDLKILLGIGSDLTTSFDTWHRAVDIVKSVSIVIFERKPHPIINLPKALKNARIHTGYALPDVASTSLRDFFRTGRRNECNFMDRSVVAYIEENNLYASAV